MKSSQSSYTPLVLRLYAPLSGGASLALACLVSLAPACSGSEETTDQPAADTTTSGGDDADASKTADDGGAPDTDPPTDAVDPDAADISPDQLVAPPDSPEVDAADRGRTDSDADDQDSDTGDASEDDADALDADGSVQSCEDLDCGSNASCIDGESGVECLCDDGFITNPDATGCVPPCDLVECGPNASCVATGPDTTCECADGFVPDPDGVGCIEPGACLGVLCVPHSTCFSFDGEPACECDPGYVPNADADLCIEDPCALVECAPGMSCTTSMDDEPFCACNAGLVPSDPGPGCEAPCGGSVTDVCPLGYDRGPTGCVDIDECASAVCGDVECSNFDGGYRCAAGCFGDDVFDGETCRLAHSCAELKLQHPEVVGIGARPLENPTTGERYGAWCDMVTAGGGWTLMFNRGTSFRTTDVPTIDPVSCAGSQCVTQSFDSVPIRRDIMLDVADDVLVDDWNRVIRTVIEGVNEPLRGMTVRSLFEEPGDWHVEQEDNCNVFNDFAEGEECPTRWMDYGRMVCGPLLVTFHDTTTPSGGTPYYIGGSEGFERPQLNIAGWPFAPLPIHYPQFFRLWVR